MTTTTEAATSAATKAEVDAGAEVEVEEEVEEAAEAEEEEAVMVAEAIKARSPTTWATTETNEAFIPAKTRRWTKKFSKETCPSS